jgi:RHS repeat-associated protein
MISGTLTTSFYGYDGHGSVRFLTSSTGAITDTYDYDAFGNLISSTGPTPNTYLFAGEQFDPALGIYYNRARYYDQRQGRFWTMDTFEGDLNAPSNLQRYVYASDNPTNFLDPTGRFLAANLYYGKVVHDEIGEDFERKIPGGFYDVGLNTILGTNIPGGGLLRPDLVDVEEHEVYEIKPSGAAELLGYSQLATYLLALNFLDPEKHLWTPGYKYSPPAIITINSQAFALVSQPKAGLITYDVLDAVETLTLLTAALSYQLSLQSVGPVLVTASTGVGL